MEIKATGPPDKVESLNLVSQIDGDDVILEWVAPYNNEGMISQYEILVK